MTFLLGLLTGLAGLAMIYTAGDGEEFPLYAGILLVSIGLYVTGAQT